MRLAISFALVLAWPVYALSQVKEPESRFGVRLNLQYYPQDTPKNTLASMMRVLEKDRYDYLVAYLLEPAFVDEQLKISYPTYEKLAGEQVQRELVEKKVVDPASIRQRIVELARQANFDHLVRRVKAQLDSDPESVRELKNLFREGEIQEGGETSVARLKDVKERALFFRKVGDRWYLENKMQEEKPGE